MSISSNSSSLGALRHGRAKSESTLSGAYSVGNVDQVRLYNSFVNKEPLPVETADMHRLKIGLRTRLIENCFSRSRVPKINEVLHRNKVKIQ